jgi:hypothetical protein
MRRRTFDPRSAKDYPPFADDPTRACKNADPLDFYPEHPSGYAHALAICHSCPIEQDCLEWALNSRQSFGVWGGVTPDERDRMIRNAQRFSRRPDN